MVNLDKELRRGEQARQLLSNELYVETFANVRQAIVDKWVASSVTDRDGHHELKLMLKLLDNLTHHINTAMETGKMAEIELEQERRKGKLRKAGLL